MDDKSTAHQWERPPIEIIPDVADSVHKLSLDSRVPTEALPYLLAHPLANVTEVVNAKPLDLRRASQWLGSVLITEELRNTMVNFADGRAASRHIMAMLVEIHGGETPPPLTTEEIMRSKQVGGVDESMPSVPSSVVDLSPRRSAALLPSVDAKFSRPPTSQKTAAFPIYPSRSLAETADEQLLATQTLVRDYREAVRAASTPDLSASSSPEAKRQLAANQAGQHLEVFITAVAAASGTVKRLFLKRLHSMTINSTGLHKDVIGEVLPDFETALGAVQTIIEQYIDTRILNAASRQKPLQRLPMIDFFLMSLLDVRDKTIADSYKAGVSTVRAGRQNVLDYVAQHISESVEVQSLAWDNDLRSGDRLPGKEDYLAASAEYFDIALTDDNIQLYEKVLSAPLSNIEEQHYRDRNIELYSKRIADFIELFTMHSALDLVVVVNNMRDLLGNYFKKRYPDSFDKDTAHREIYPHLQSNIEILLSAVDGLVQSELKLYGGLQPATADIIKSFWIMVTTKNEKYLAISEEQAKVYDFVLAGLPDVTGLTYRQASYALRHRGRELVYERYNLSGTFVLGEGSKVLADIFVSPHTLVPGTAASLGELAAQAVAHSPQRERIPTGRGSSASGLSEKQMQIARLYAQGRTPPEIMEELGVSSSYVPAAVNKVVAHLEAHGNINPTLLQEIRKQRALALARRGKYDRAGSGARSTSMPSKNIASRPESARPAIKGRAPSSYSPKADLLKADEEVILAKRIEAGVLAQEQLDIAVSNKRKLDSIYRRELEWLVDDGAAAREHMIMANVRLADTYAWRSSQRGLPWEDVRQIAYLGLMHAVEKFDFKKGYKFSTVAAGWIREHITRDIDTQARAVRVPVGVHEFVRQVNRASRQMSHQLQRIPTDEELAVKLETTVKKIQQARLDTRPIEQLDAPLFEEGGKTYGNKYLSEEAVQSAFSPAARQAAVAAVLQRVLTEDEGNILADSFGLMNGRPMLLKDLALKHGYPPVQMRRKLEATIEKLRDSEIGHQIAEILDS